MMCSRSRVSINSRGTLHISMTSDTRRYFRAMALLSQAQVFAHVLAVSAINFLDNVLSDFVLRHPYHQMQIQVSCRFSPVRRDSLAFHAKTLPALSARVDFYFHNAHGRRHLDTGATDGLSHGDRQVHRQISA